MRMRQDKDSLGPVDVPETAYYGAETQRAVNHYAISGIKPHPQYIRATILVKKAAAIVNHQLGLLDDKVAQAIIQTCDEILDGKLVDQFVVDAYQSGAGTSHNMNANEVIANRANEILGAKLGSYEYINPHDHVNKAQSTNDVIPTVMRITILQLLPALLDSIKQVEAGMTVKAEEFEHIIKPGRTHLQDALPVTLGQEFLVYKAAIEHDRERIETSAKRLLRIGIGGTAVGTGINSHPEYHQRMVKELATLSGLPLESIGNLFEPTQSTADLLDFSSMLRVLAYTLIRIGGDLRLLASGPRTGFGEIRLPAVQAGSSIMPGKVNPSVIEMMMMVCFQVIGHDLAIAHGTGATQLELNVWFPLIIHNLCDQMTLLTRALPVFSHACLAGIEADEERCKFLLERGVGLGAVLNELIGYDKAAEVVNYAKEHDLSIPEAAKEKGFVTDEQIKILFDKSTLTHPNLK